MKTTHTGWSARSVGTVLLLAVGLILLSACSASTRNGNVSEGGDGSSDTMMARIEHTPVGELEARSTATFSARDSSLGIPQSSISEVRYQWEFGDGGTAAGESVSHVFDEPGTYDVTLTIEVITTESQFHTVTTSEDVGVVPPTIGQLNAVVSYDESRTWFSDESIPFDVNGSTVDGFDYTTLADRQVTWTFGDGTPDSFGTQVSHAYSTPGEFDVTVHIAGTDSFGRRLQAEASRTVAVKNRPPVIEASIVPVGGEDRIQPGKPVNLLASDSTDPEGQTLYVEWDIDSDNIADVLQTDVLDQRYEHGFPRVGTYTVQVRVWDQYMLDTAQPPETRTLEVRVGAGGTLPVSFELGGFVASAGLMMFDDVRLWQAQAGMQFMEGNLVATVGFGASTGAITIPMTDAFPAVKNAGYEISAVLESANLISASGFYQVYPNVYLGGMIGMLTCKGAYRASTRVSIGGQATPIAFSQQSIVFGASVGYRLAFGLITFSVTVAP